MEISKIQEGVTLTVKIKGSINTLTAPDIEKELQQGLNGINRLVIDLKEVDYISSAGLRVLTAIKFNMSKQGGYFEIININEVVNNVFEITNFYELLNIKRK